MGNREQTTATNSMRLLRTKLEEFRRYTMTMYPINHFDCTVINSLCLIFYLFMFYVLQLLFTFQAFSVDIVVHVHCNVYSYQAKANSVHPSSNYFPIRCNMMSISTLFYKHTALLTTPNTPKLGKHIYSCVEFEVITRYGFYFLELSNLLFTEFSSY